MNLAPFLLMSLLPMASPTLAEPSSAPDSAGRILEDFSNQDAGRAWRVVTDRVMGGISRGSVSVREGKLTFSGETRLENRGGFSSIRSTSRDWQLADAKEITVRIRGNADRGYTMLLRSGGASGGRTVSYWQPFRLQGDDWQIVNLPLSDFFPNWRGRRLQGPALAPADIRSLGLMVNDKKAGAFEVEIDWIKAIPAIPESKVLDAPTVVDIAASDDRFSTLVRALQAAGLVETLAAKGPWTVFAPTNEAFDALPEGVLEKLLMPGNRDQLQALLLKHVIPGTLSGADLVTAAKATSASGDSIALRLEGGRLMANDATIISNDLAAANGIVQVIDSVLLSSSLPAADPAIRLIETAVARGSALFNDGQTDACAAIYEVTATALLAFKESQAIDKTRKILATALEAARNNRDSRESAWILRRALDRAATAAAR